MPTTIHVAWCALHPDRQQQTAANKRKKLSWREACVTPQHCAVLRSPTPTPSPFRNRDPLSSPEGRERRTSVRGRKARKDRIIFRRPPLVQRTGCLDWRACRESVLQLRPWFLRSAGATSAVLYGFLPVELPMPLRTFSSGIYVVFLSVKYSDRIRNFPENAACAVDRPFQRT